MPRYNRMCGCPQLPRGRILQDYGRDPGSSIASEGNGLSGKRSFWVKVGDIVEIMDIEDDVWWMVHKLEVESPPMVQYQEISAPVPRQGWVPAPHVCLLSHRRSAYTHMTCGHEDWRGTSGTAESASPDCDEISEQTSTVNGEDREVAKIMTYKRIIAWRAVSKGVKTDVILMQWLFDHPLCHGAVLCLLAAHCACAHAASPSLLQCAVGTALGFIAVDLLSTACKQTAPSLPARTNILHWDSKTNVFVRKLSPSPSFPIPPFILPLSFA
eukprot:SAG11_NODE_175_length_13457_cov_42.095673_3_plen_270_part_00